MAAQNTSLGGSAFDMAMEDRASAQPAYGRQLIGPEAKRAAVHEEMKRMTKLPVTSSYASHRLRVLNKILQLLSLQYITGCGVGTAFLWAVPVSQPSRLAFCVLLMPPVLVTEAKERSGCVQNIKSWISAWVDKGGFASCTQCREDL